MAKKLTAERKTQIEGYLHDYLDPKDGKDAKVYCILRHVSKSGMMRVIGLYALKDGDLVPIHHLAAELLGYGYDRDRCGVKMTGVGMDMGFALTHELARALGLRIIYNWL